jgi:hypothetical protein
MIEISPHRNGWKVFEAAWRRVCFRYERSGDQLCAEPREPFAQQSFGFSIQAGYVEHAIPFQRNGSKAVTCHAAKLAPSGSLGGTNRNLLRWRSSWKVPIKRPNVCCNS